MKTLGLAVILPALMTGCSADHESTIGQFSAMANFPMYYLVGGDDEESGVLYKVSEVSVGQTVSSEQVVSGFTSPGGIAQDTAGNIYIPEVLPEPDGRVLKIPANSTELREFMVELDYPTGIALDTFNQVYVIENGKHRITRKDATGAVAAFKETEIDSPEVGVVDSSDNLYLVESGTKVVSRIDPDGNRTVVSPVMDGILSIAIDAAGVINVLVVDGTAGIGAVHRVYGEDRTEVIVEDLVNPLAFAFDSANAMYIAEGAPANRISRLAVGESSRRVIVNSDAEPKALMFTPY